MEHRNATTQSVITQLQTMTTTSVNFPRVVTVMEQILGPQDRPAESTVGSHFCTYA